MKRLVVVGAGMRCYAMWAVSLKEKYADRVEIVGVYDLNRVRSEYFQKNINPKMEIFDDFDTMLDTLHPDIVMVTTKDSVHHQYIIRALEKGYDVLTEKPMTDTEEKCYAIRQAEKQSGKEVTVTFNCRFMPYFIKLKELASSGIIGRIFNITYDYRLNNAHGGDYFKRWHRKMENCGGMLVHKSTHHFDIINWLLDDAPKAVSAQGTRLYYRPENHHWSERCRQCPHIDTCESTSKSLLTDEKTNEMYFKAEGVDGFVRDHCAFYGDADIYDTMSVSVAYEKGTILTYTLCMYCTEEGFVLNLVGEKGKIEYTNLIPGKEDKVYVTLRTGEVQEYPIPRETGMHDGGDDRMLSMFFGGVTDDPLHQCATSYDGIKSAMIGIAANQSIATGRRIELAPVLEKLK